MKAITLIIEKQEKVLINDSLLTYIYGPSFGENVPAEVKWAQNQARLHFGRKDGYEITAIFHAGTISVEKLKLDPREPLDNQTCKHLFSDYLECGNPDRFRTGGGCRRSGSRPVIGLQTSFGGGKTHTMLALAAVPTANRPDF
jgi:hypothetical protein